MNEQLTVERCIDIHDTSTATHVFEWRNGFATYLLRNVTVLNTGLIEADYGLMREDGVFMGWQSEALVDVPGTPDPTPGMFVPALGKLLPFKPWDCARRQRRAFDKAMKFPERYGLSGTALKERLSPLFQSTKEGS